MKCRYIDLFTDFGFKRIFGEERSKPNLISFLNTLLPERHHIADLNFGKNEQQSNSALDLNCVSSSGDHFIVELQQAKQNFFKDRRLFVRHLPGPATGGPGGVGFQAERGLHHRHPRLPV